MSLEDTEEYKQSKRMRSACNRVLREVFDVNNEQIRRYNTEERDDKILDREFAIDLRVTLPSGAVLSGQEKTLSNEFHDYRTFTIEYYQTEKKEEPGEWFHIASQFYLHGYGNKDNNEFAEWYIIDMLDFMYWLRETEHLSTKTKSAGGSKAAFLPIKYDQIPESCIFAKGHGPGDTIIQHKFNLGDKI